MQMILHGLEEYVCHSSDPTTLFQSCKQHSLLSLYLSKINKTLDSKLPAMNLKLVMVYQFLSTLVEWRPSLYCNSSHLYYSSWGQNKTAWGYPPAKTPTRIESKPTWLKCKMFGKPYLVKQDSVSIKIMIQPPALAATVLQCLCQVETHSQSHSPFHWLLVPFLTIHITNIINH